ncbi:MAG: hypothetical protein R3Y61_02730 [Rikenellaceae bacterium]
MKKFLLLAVCVVASSLSLSAQDYSGPEFAKYGELEHREENIKKLNFFNDAYTTKAYDEALLLMHYIIENCPQASLNVYIKGGDVYRIKMARSRSKDDRMAYLDSMLYLLDKRIEFFGDHSKYGENYLRAQKAYIFNENNPADRAKAFSLFKEAIEVSGHEVDPELCVVFFNSLTESFKLDDITPEEYLQDFDLVMFALESGDKTDEDLEAISIIENLFASSGAATCDNIESIFRPQYEKDPENGVLVKKILSLFNRSKCSTAFQFELTKKYYDIEPSPELASMLGGIYEERGDFDNAVKYFQIAIDSEGDATKKYQLLLRITNASINANKNSQAADFAKQMIALEPDNGYGYLFLATAYSGGLNNCSGFEAQAASWLVVDAYTRARAKFEGDQTQIDNINKMISSYASMYPKVEDTFMRGLKPGDPYTVRCGWLSGSTTVRER